MPIFKKVRDAIFQHPIRSSIGIGVTFFSALIAPTLYKLIPAGQDRTNAQNDRDHASDEYDQALQNVNNNNAKIIEYEQRVIDLDCAMAGYQSFNLGVMTFQQNISNSMMTPMERLHAFWQIQFLADTETLTEFDTARSWDEEVDDSYYGCTAYNCGVNMNECCYGLISSTKTITHDYTETTRIVNKYIGIIKASPLSLPSLDCGYYARRFETTSPATFVSFESDHIDSGDREDGHTWVDFYREYASKTTVKFELDKVVTFLEAPVLRITDQILGASDLATKLFQHLGTALTAFNLTGANYSNVQIEYRDQIPGLIELRAVLNATLLEKEKILSEKQAIFDDEHADFMSQIGLWLPLLLCTSVGIAFFTYLFLTRCSNACKFDSNPPVENNRVHQLPNQANPVQNHAIEVAMAPIHREPSLPTYDEAQAHRAINIFHDNPGQIIVRLNQLPPPAYTPRDQLAPAAYSPRFFDVRYAVAPERHLEEPEGPLTPPPVYSAN